MEFEKINLITNNFFHNSKVLNIVLIDSGLINKTFIIEYSNNRKKSKFILQCLSNVFESYEIVNMNHELITDHIKRKIKQNYLNLNCQRLEVASLIRCMSNNLFVFPSDSGFWRAMVYIDNTFSVDILEDKNMAYQTGIGLSKFHLACSDLDHTKLEKSIKHFHNTKYFIEQFNTSLQNFNFMKLDEEIRKRVQKLIFNLSNQIVHVNYILELLKKKSIALSVIHGDPKISNFLFDIKDNYVVSLIDLDTVSSGYLLTDLADCIRSICNLGGEDPKTMKNVCFDIDSCKYFLKGYFSLSNEDENESFRFLPEFIYLIIFELSIRFLTDFLQLNRYFKIKYKTHNLYRAEVQYRLLSSLLNQMSDLSNELDKIGFSSSSTFVSDIKKNL